MGIFVFRSKYPAIIDILKGLSRVPFKMDTHTVHANRILPVSARTVGNAPVGSNSSGPAVIPSVSEGGTMVGERSMRKTPQASSFGSRWRIADCCKECAQPERWGDVPDDGTAYR